MSEELGFVNDCDFASSFAIWFVDAFVDADETFAREYVDAVQSNP
jgi:hypothetical protein